MATSPTTVTVNLSVVPGSILPVVHVSQYDVGSRTLKFNLVSYTIPDGATVAIRGTKPDKTGFSYACTVADGGASVVVRDQMTVCAGRVRCELTISQNGTILHTARFVLDVDKAPLDSATAISKTDMSTIEKATQDAAKSATDSAASADSASSAASAAGKSQIAAANSATSAAQSASAAKTSAEAANRAEKANADAITQEVADRKSADSALNDSIQAEAERAQAAETANYNSIVKEVTDRTTAISNVEEALATETTTRISSDNTFSAHVANSENPHKVTKAQVGLGNVDNTADADKPVSKDTQTALDKKADKDGIDLLKKFIDYNNYEVSEFHDSVTDTQYQVIRIYQTKLDGTKQYPFVVCPNGTEKATYSASTLNHEKEYLLAINAGVFDMSTLKPDGVVVENGKVIQDSVSATSSKCMPLTIDARGNLSYTAYDKTAASMISDGIVSAVCGFMPIITNYEKFDSSKWNSVDHYTEAAQRQIIGQYGNGDYCIITSEGRNFDNSVGWTIAQAQDICQGLGLKFAYNLDGGGSVETMLMKRQANIVYEGKSGRICPTFICFNGTDNFDGTQTEIDSSYSYITSVHLPKAAYIDTGGWFRQLKQVHHIVTV